MSKFTPGPWKWWDESTGRPAKYDIARLLTTKEGREGKTIFSCYGGPGKMALASKLAPDEADIANAQLIESAPDMYEALSQIQLMAVDAQLRASHQRTALDNISTLSREILAKARGNP